MPELFPMLTFRCPSKGCDWEARIEVAENARDSSDGFPLGSGSEEEWENRYLRPAMDTLRMDAKHKCPYVKAAGR